ncbi:MAG: dGTPase, partial [Bacteroidota bacterium]
EKVYQSKEVVEKEIAGYEILTTLLDGYTSAFENAHKSTLRHYDKLLLRSMGVVGPNTGTVYEYLMECCHFVSRLTDGNALQHFQKMKGGV